MPGLGWIRVTGTAKVAVWAQEGIAVVTRQLFKHRKERVVKAGIASPMENTFSLWCPVGTKVIVPALEEKYFRLKFLVMKSRRTLRRPSPL